MTITKHHCPTPPNIKALIGIDSDLRREFTKYLINQGINDDPHSNDAFYGLRHNVIEGFWSNPDSFWPYLGSPDGLDQLSIAINAHLAENGASTAEANDYRKSAAYLGNFIRQRQPSIGAPNSLSEQLDQVIATTKLLASQLKKIRNSVGDK